MGRVTPANVVAAQTVAHGHQKCAAVAAVQMPAQIETELRVQIKGW